MDCVVWQKPEFFFLFFLDNVKPMKRGRVPKGFLSSNTAYMLVYKKLTTDWPVSATKKMKLKKFDAEVSVSGNPVNLERLTVKDQSDTSDEAEQKNGVGDVSPTEEGSPERIPKLEPENKIEVDESVASQNIDAPMLKNETVETVVNTDECKDKCDPVVQQLQNKIQHPKKPIVKIVKLDYKRLNGAAHRAMSCGERDFYEEVRYRFLRYILDIIKDNHSSAFICICFSTDGIRELASEQHNARTR